MTKKRKPLICPYCQSVAKCVDSSLIYGRSYGWAWVCERYPQCDSYVGCHPGTRKPLGRLSDATLRAAKNEAHNKFDRMWRGNMLRRKDAYHWLANQLNIRFEYCHIGMFDVEQCQRVFEICKLVEA